MKPTIEIIIQPTGQIRVDAVDFKGADCEQATEYLEEALGVVGQRQRKPEFHQYRRRQVRQGLGQ